MALFFTTGLVLAQEKTIIYFFEADGCPHCAKEKAFLEKLKLEDPDIEIKEYEITKNKQNQELLKRMSDKLFVNISNIPITFIGNKFFVGYQDDETHGALIKNLINEHRAKKCPDIAGPLISEYQKECEENQNSQPSAPENIHLPFWGETNIKNLSLPLFTIIIGGIDGFNPCSMWVLIFLIGLLLGMKNKKRMWILGGTFIFSSSLVYFLFMAAWLNLLLFIGFIFWIRIAIALIAVVSGIYYLKKYMEGKADVCEISENKKQQKIFDKLKKITQKNQFWLALAGIILLAAAVNLVELICSAGFPAVYTQVLTLSHLSAPQYYSYLILYIFFFMLDDIIIFTIAMLTLKNVHLTKKYSRFSCLVGGILMTLIGLLLIFKPAWLMFG